MDGKYVDPFEQVQQLPEGGVMYGGDAFWNTFWNGVQKSCNYGTQKNSISGGYVCSIFWDIEKPATSKSQPKCFSVGREFGI